MLSNLHILIQHRLRKRPPRLVTLHCCKLCKMSRIGSSFRETQLVYGFNIVRRCTLHGDNVFVGKLVSVISTSDERTLNLMGHTLFDPTVVGRNSRYIHLSYLVVCQNGFYEFIVLLA